MTRGRNFLLARSGVSEAEGGRESYLWVLTRASRRNTPSKPVLRQRGGLPKIPRRPPTRMVPPKIVVKHSEDQMILDCETYALDNKSVACTRRQAPT